jgi:putative glycosyl hydrolase-like family 15 (GHL15) protein
MMARSNFQCESVFRAPFNQIVRSCLAASRRETRRCRGSRAAAFQLAAALVLWAGVARAAPVLTATEGHINFYKHTTPADDLYTGSPSPAGVQFMNTHWPRLLSYSGYWDGKLSWFPNAWMYADAYALSSDPNNTFVAQLIQMHPDWVLRDAQGNPLYIKWECGGGSCPEYAANLSDPNGFPAWWIQQVRLSLSRKPAYKGLYIDDVNLDMSRISDGYGNPAAAIDPRTGSPMTDSAWKNDFAGFLQQVRAAFPNVEIVHNSIWSLDWTDSNIQREIQAADWINIERGVNDSGLTGGNGYWSLYRLMSFIGAVHKNGKGVILDGEAPLSDSDAAREYSAAFYLLISTGADLVGDSSQSPVHWWSGFDVDLGKAAGGAYVWQNVWRRDFAGGMALVNPPGSDAVVVTLPAPFTRVDGSVVNSIRLGPAEGAILKSTGAGNLSSLECGPVVLAEGITPTCTVTLTSAAPPAGATIKLSSSSNLLLRVPALVFVPAGATSATFTASPGVGAGRTATVFARMGSTSFDVTFDVAAPVVWPARVPGPAAP